MGGENRWTDNDFHSQVAFVRFESRMSAREIKVSPGFSRCGHQSKSNSYSRRLFSTATLWLVRAGFGSRVELGFQSFQLTVLIGVVFGVRKTWCCLLR